MIGKKKRDKPIGGKIYEVTDETITNVLMEVVRSRGFKNFTLVEKDGKKYLIEHMNIDEIIDDL